MKTAILGMLAETFIHPGSGHSVGGIDLPVAREAATSYPFIAGSSLKGAMRDVYEQVDNSIAGTIFGKTDDSDSQGHAGNILVSDARLLLLPVRSLSSNYKWLTCPHLLERLHRDSARGKITLPKPFTVPTIAKKQVLTSGTGKLFLEELSFDIVAQVPADLIVNLKILIHHEGTKSRLNEQLAIVSDEDFSHFARYALAIQARNALDSKTKTTITGALWYEETLPPDTLMYSVIIERTGDTLTQVKQRIGNYLQVGGNETVGQGWFALNWLEGRDE